MTEIYSLRVINNGFSDGRYLVKSIKDIIGQLEYFRLCADCDKDLEESAITIYIDGTDDLIAFKDEDESFDDFLVELELQSKLLGE